MSLLPLEIKQTPVNFDIQCAGNVAITDLYTVSTIGIWDKQTKK
jgi:hypothetical protein